MSKLLFNIEEYKRVTYPGLEPISFPYFCVGYYTKGYNHWKIFEQTFNNDSCDAIKKFIKEKEDTGWIMFICKLPDLRKGKNE